MKPLIRVARGLSALNARLTNGGRTAAGVLLAVMLIVVMAQVFMRYIVGSSLSWSEEVSKTLMVWSVFFVSPWAYRNGANVAIEVLPRGFSPRFRVGVEIVLTLVILWLLARFFWESLFFVARGQTVTAASLPIPMSWLYVVTPVSLGGMLLVGVEMLLRQGLRFFGHPEFDG